VTTEFSRDALGEATVELHTNWVLEDATCVAGFGGLSS